MLQAKLLREIVRGRIKESLLVRKICVEIFKRRTNFPPEPRYLCIYNLQKNKDKRDELRHSRPGLGPNSVRKNWFLKPGWLAGRVRWSARHVSRVWCCCPRAVATKERSPSLFICIRVCTCRGWNFPPTHLSRTRLRIKFLLVVRVTELCANHLNFEKAVTFIFGECDATENIDAANRSRLYFAPPRCAAIGVGKNHVRVTRIRCFCIFNQGYSENNVHIHFILRERVPVF